MEELSGMRARYMLMVSIFFLSIVFIQYAIAQSSDKVAEVNIMNYHLKEGMERYSDVLKNAVFSPDGSMLAVMTSKGIHLYDTGGLMEINFFRTETPTNFISFSPDGNLLAAGGDDNTVRIWDVKNRLEAAVLSGHKAKISAVKFSPDGSILASGSEDGIVKLWDTKTRFLITTIIGHEGRIIFIDFNTNANMIVTGSDDNILKLWDSKSYQELAVLRTKLDWALSDQFNLQERVVSKRQQYTEMLKVSDLKVPESAINIGDTAPMEMLAEYTGDKTALMYAWSANAGNIQGSGNKAIYKAPESPGSYSVNVRATDGNISSERTAEISVQQVSKETMTIDSNRHWPATAYKDGLSYNIKVTGLSSNKVIFHYDITQDKDNYDAFLSIEIGSRTILEDMAIGNEQPSTGTRTVRDIDVSDIIKGTGQYVITLYIRPGDRIEKGWLLNEVSLSGVEGSIEKL